jgi:hypothetical protein
MAEKQKKEWKQFPLPEYCRFAKKMVHFSFKTVNSNCAGGGVRLGPDDGLNLPYVAARVLLARGVPLEVDYIDNGNKPPLDRKLLPEKTIYTAKISNQIRTALYDEGPEDATDAKRVAEACRPIVATHHEENCQKISPRLRQLLLPKGDSYVAVTPLGAGSLNATFNAMVTAHNKSHSDAVKSAKTQTERDQIRTRYLRQAQFGIGGSKPQNVGSLARAMQTPLYFEAPPESLRVRSALFVHHNGIRLAISRNLAERYRDWLREIRKDHEGVMPASMKIRQKHQQFIQQIIDEALGRGRWAKALLLENQDHLPNDGDPLVSEEVDPVIRGLIDPVLRLSDWEYRFAWLLANRLAVYEFRDQYGDVEGTLELDNDAVAQIAQIIKGVE